MWSFEHAALDVAAVLMQVTKARAINSYKSLTAFVHGISI